MWLGTISVTENRLLETMAQDDSSQTRGIYSSSPLYSGSDLSRHGSACQPHLLSMIRAKDLLPPRSRPRANTEKSHKDGSIPQSYLCELLTAAELFSEGVELCSDPLVGPVQLFG